MEIYTSFAQVYDHFMDNVPYDLWTEYIVQIWEKHGIAPGLVLDLACGTGNMTMRLSQKGYDMIGVDASEDMLAVAREKEEKIRAEGRGCAGNILYLCQDMREFELYGTVDSIICICDSINYITDITELETVFELVQNYLNPGGLFVFDVNTQYKFEQMGDQSFSELRDELAYIWDNYYDSNAKVNEYQAAFFIRNNQNGLYERFDELHYERAYSTQEITRALQRSGLKSAGVYHELTFDPPKAESERIFYVAKKRQQDKN